jgi:hypothetical protein
MEQNKNKEEWIQKQLGRVNPSDSELMPSPFLFGKIRVHLHRSNNPVRSRRQLILAGVSMCLLCILNIGAVFYLYSYTQVDSTASVQESTTTEDILFSYTDIYY